jgi:hypothetical protein
MKKETATEWLFNKLWEEPKDKLTWYTILSKAKEMEKQQIMNAWARGITSENNATAEQHYNETFKQQEQ